jgi:inosose dehydratase
MLSSSRRDFLRNLATAGALASVSSFAHGASNALGATPGAAPRGVTPELRIGYSAIAWNDQDVQAINDLSALGFPGIQLRANAVTDFPDPHALRDLLAQRHLTFVALSSGTAPIDPAVRQKTIDDHVRNAKFLREAGGHYLQVVAASNKGRTFTADDFRYEGQLLTEVGKAVADMGLQFSLHNHMGTMAQTPQGMDAIFDAADPKYLKLELDTAHYLQGGGDPAAAIKQYENRLLFLHLKDVRDAPTKSGYEFTELGQGRLDFPASFAALRSIGFKGWGIIELDGERVPPVHTPRESAEISRQYLEKLGIHI